VRTLSRQGGQRDLAAVAAVAQELGAGGLVLGLPLDLSGEEGEAARRVRDLGAALAAHLGCVVHYWDERFSTAAAERALLEGNVRRKQRKQLVNHVAATLILQSFLDSAAGRAAQAAGVSG
jgi:putative holliday junction resolvase